MFFADLFWSAAAWLVDYSKLANIPLWGWPFALLCPIYPFLLALVWLMLLKQDKVNPYLLAFASIPAAVLGILALFYYPSKMYFQGFSLRDFGQIFWVLFYSLQGWYLLVSRKIKIIPVLVTILFFGGLLVTDFIFKTFGYLSFDAFSVHSLYFLLGLGILSTVIVAMIAIRRSNSA